MSLRLGRQADALCGSNTVFVCRSLEWISQTQDHVHHTNQGRQRRSEADGVGGTTALDGGFGNLLGGLQQGLAAWKRWRGGERFN